MKRFRPAPDSPAALTLDFARALDPVSIMTDAGLEADPWQADLLRSECSLELVNCSRQVGKSTTCAALALHGAIYDPGLVLLIAPTLRQSGELFRKVKEFHARLSYAPEIAEESALRYEFKNSARIVALPGNESTVRGFSAAKLVIVDESARVPDSLIASIRPMLATTQGRFIGVSTPYGRRGWWYEAWEHGKGWRRTRIRADECPRISPEWLAEEKRLLGPLMFAQEFMTDFTDIEEQLFSSAIIEAALSDQVRPLWQG